MIVFHHHIRVILSAWLCVHLYFIYYFRFLVGHEVEVTVNLNNVKANYFRL